MSTYTYTPSLYQFPSLLKALAQTSGPSPSLDLRFALDKSLTAYRGPTPSFSRASTGTYFDASGVLRYAALNLLTYSEDFTNGVWLKANSSISSNVATSPTGTLTADKLVENTAGPTTHVVTYGSATTGTLFSVYAKAGERGWMALQQNNPGRYCYFDLVNGVVGTASGATGSISSAGNGWYRCSILVPSGSSLWDIFVSPSDNGAGYTGNGTSGIFIWGAQLEASSTVGTYCPTTSAANSAPRFNHTYNGTSWVSRGLLVEDQRTNSSPYSVTFNSGNAPWGMADLSISLNSATAPDGTNTATKLIDNVANSNHNIYRQISFSGTITFSVFAKAAGRNYVQIFIGNLGSPEVGINVDLTNGTITNQSPSVVASGTQDVGNGWYRIWFSATGAGGIYYPAIATSNAATGIRGVYTGDGSSGVFIWGAQWESGSFPTSYIGNSGNGSTTRSADVCQITGGDFSGFWNGTEGSIAVEFDQLADATKMTNESYIYGFQNAADTEQFILRGQNSGIYYWRSVNNGNIEATAQISSLGTSPVKHAAGYKVNDFASTFNGAAVVSDTSGATPNPTALGIGFNWTSGTNRINGHIARLRYYRKRLPNATLQLLSDPDPTLNLQFALNRSLTPVAGPTPSFSRASTGSYFDSTGTLKYANVNLLTYSEQFDNAAWTKYELTIDQTLYSSPNGSLSARRIIETSNNDLHATWRQIVTTVSGTFTDTIYMKAGERQYGYLQIANNAGDRYTVLVDLINGLVVTTSTSGTIANQSNSIESVGNGWYRIRVTASFPNGGTYVQLIAGPSNSSTPTFIYGCPSYAGDTSKGIYIFGAQLENGSSPSQYAKTEASTTAGPRFDHVYSGGQWVSRGLLLEEQRTNLILYSNDLTNAAWNAIGNLTPTSNAAISPEGLTNANQIMETTANSTHFALQAYAKTSATYTLSAFVKPNGRDRIYLDLNVGSTDYIGYFDLTAKTYLGNGGYSNVDSYSITDVGNGWVRVSITKTTNLSNYGIFLSNGIGISYSGDATKGVYIYGVQLETGSFPTSYTGTTSSSVTRSADVCQITGTSFNWMWNQGEGSLFFDADGFSTSISNQFITSASSGASSNSINLVRSNANDVTGVGSSVLVGGVVQEAMNAAAGTWPTGSSCKLSFGYKANDFAQSINGTAVTTDTSGSIPTVSQMVIGDAGWTTGTLNGHIAKLIYYPARLTNTKLQQLST